MHYSTNHREAGRKKKMTNKLILPEGCELRSYGDGRLLVGVGLTAEKYEEIKAGFPASLQARLIGWRRICVAR